MNFHIDQDRGKIISGWFAPDNPSREPVILVDADGRSYAIRAKNVHTDMVTNGWHDTGRVGFEITPNEVPGLHKAVDVRLTEQDCGLTFYVRPKPQPYVAGRLFAFDMREGADSICAHAFPPGFQIAFHDIHGYGLETRKIFYQIKYTNSLFVSGAPCVRADEPFVIEAHVKRVALLADPVRLLFDQLMPDTHPDAPGAATLIARRIAALDKHDRQLLSEPLTRRLSLIYLEDKMERDALGASLDTLSSFEAIGVEDAIGAFVELTAAVCDTDVSVFRMPPELPMFPLSKALRRESEVVSLVGRDLDIYDAAWDAIAEAHRERA